MQNVSIGDNMYEMSKPIFWGKEKEKNNISLSSVELAQVVVMVKCQMYLVLVNDALQFLSCKYLQKQIMYLSSQRAR